MPRVGRGNASGKGTYSSRGIKGQRARSGGAKGLKKRSLMRQLIKKTPKLGGFRSLAKKIATITLTDIETHFKNGEIITYSMLREKNLLQKRMHAKIVATGKLTKKLTVQKILISKTAAEKIRAMGGSIE